MNPIKFNNYNCLSLNLTFNDLEFPSSYAGGIIFLFLDVLHESSWLGPSSAVVQGGARASMSRWSSVF